jgi:cytochrome c-type biogenesis protein
VFVFGDGTTGSTTWTLPVDLSGSAVTAPPVALANLNAVLRKVRSDVMYGDVRDAELSVTYATPEYFQAALSPEASRRLSPASYAVFLVSETTHTTDLPSELPAFTLRFQGQTYTPDLVEPTVSSAHHRVTMLRFPVDPSRALLVSSLELRLPDGSSMSWGLPIVYADGERHGSIEFNAGSVLSLVGGMLAAMWPCLFQLTVFFIPALAGVSMEEAYSSTGWRSRVRVLRAALFFIAGFTIVYTAAGALVGFAVQKFGSAPELDAWQRYFGVGAGLAIIVLALRTAAKVRAPLVCKMPVLSRMATGRKASGPVELMLAGLAFATGCMTCFGAALIIAMVVYVGMAGSALVGGLTLFLFSMGMGIPLLIAAAAMGKALPVLNRLERITPWMGLASSVVMIGYAILLMTGNYMAVTNWLIERL